MKNKKNAKQKKSRGMIQSHQRGSIYIAIFALLLLIVVVGVSTWSLKQKKDEYQATEIEIEKQIEEEKARSEEIDEQEEYMKSEDYVKDVARDKLNLVEPDEIMFKAQ